MDPLLVTLVGLAMLAGLVGVVLPLIPGVPLMWVAALVFGLFAGFGSVGLTAMAAITVLAGLGIAAGIVLPSRAGTESGASRSTMLFALGAGVVGFFVIPVFGFPIGALLGVLLAQYRETGDWGRARESTVAVLRGFGIGVVAELGAAVAIILVWIAWISLA